MKIISWYRNYLKCFDMVNFTFGKVFGSFTCIPPIGMTLSGIGPSWSKIGFELTRASVARFSNWLIDGKSPPKCSAIIKSNRARRTYSRPLYYTIKREEENS